MVTIHRIKKIVWIGLAIFLVSGIILSFIGAYIGLKGKQRAYNTLPTQPYKEVSFLSETRDHMRLFGWFFPSQSDQVAVIVHGWGGHRARYLPLAEFFSA